MFGNGGQYYIVKVYSLFKKINAQVMLDDKIL